jgi:CMP-N,N'-diacetyllegionaminic acid synthase
MPFCVRSATRDPVIGERTVLGVIPARGGSKAVARKNLRPLAGKPLLQWTAEAALASTLVDRLILSTDDDETAQMGVSLGLEVPFRRPTAAASDTATAVDVLRHVIAALDQQFDYVVYLQPTSPLRSTADIDGCLERLTPGDGDFCVSVKASHERPEWMFYLKADDQMDPVVGRFPASRRQDLRPCYVLNGAVYAARVDAFERAGTFLTKRTLAYVMPEERSIDIDELADFAAAEAILRRGRPAPA